VKLKKENQVIEKVKKHLIKTKLRIKKALSGKKHSEKHKDTLSKIRKQLIWVNNNIQSKRIKKDDIQNYLNIGYKLGRDKSYLTKEYSLKMSKLTQSYWDRKSSIMSYTNGLDKPSDYFNTVLYTGTGASNSVTGVGFQSDLLWFKNRSSALNHILFDSVRGIDKYFYVNLNEAEGTSATILTAVGSDGFTVGANDNVNENTKGIVSWNWLANGAGVSNTDGSITSTVSANTTSGFSIVSYTGNSVSATVGHGLGVEPKFIIIKHRNDADDWTCYHTLL
jgi:hypothetical protein